MVSIDQHETVDDWEQACLKAGQSYLPLVGRSESMTPRELATRAKVQHVLGFLATEHAALLNMRHVEQMTWEAMGDELKCTYQAAQQRVRVAEQDFHKIWAEHADDPVDWDDAI